jgi:hypothetical protein
MICEPTNACLNSKLKIPCTKIDAIVIDSLQARTNNCGYSEEREVSLIHLSVRR